jgi:hypothetical protein
MLPGTSGMVLRWTGGVLSIKLRIAWCCVEQVASHVSSFSIIHFESLLELSNERSPNFLTVPTARWINRIFVNIITIAKQHNFRRNRHASVIPWEQLGTCLKLKIIIIINMLMPVNWIVLHILLPYRYSMTAALHSLLNNNEHAYAGQLNSFTHLRALLILHFRGIT